MAVRLQTPSLQVVKDQRHYVFSLQRVDDGHGDADVEDDVKRMMDQLKLEQRMNGSDGGMDLNVVVVDIWCVVVSNVVETKVVPVVVGLIV
jgi:hypothetical protein